MDKEYNKTWLTPNEYSEICRFLPHSKIEDLDVDETIKSKKSAISISAGPSANSFGLALKYINTDGKLRNLDWPDMSRDTLQNLTICLRKILSEIEDEIEKEYTKHPKEKDLLDEVKRIVNKKRRGHGSTAIVIDVRERELTPEDKKADLVYVIDIDRGAIVLAGPNRGKPHYSQRMTLGIDKNNLLRYVEDRYSRNLDQLTPTNLIKWDKLSGKIEEFAENPFA